MSLAPHGGTLINRVNEQYNLTSVHKEIELDLISFADLELIGIGGYSPGRIECGHISSAV